jgi:2-aminobenzoate-CoA ligase
VLGPSGHMDTFSRDNLPPSEQWPEFLLDGFDYPEWLNCGYELTDAMVAKGFGDHTALIGNGRIRTYKELTDWTNRIAHVLVEDYGVKPGNRVLIRSANNPAMVASGWRRPRPARWWSTPCRCCARWSLARSSTRRRSRWRCATQG